MRIAHIDTTEQVLVVAEVGNNHEGDFDTAQELVRQASKAGAHAVKFQTFKAELYVSASDEARFRQLKSFELSYEQFERLAELAHSLGLIFISTPFDLESAAFLAGVADALKIASGDNTFYPLIHEAAMSTKPLVISSGISALAELKNAVNAVESVRGPRAEPGLAILHCLSSYPALPGDVNLRSIPYLQEHLPYPIGYSDHTIGIDSALLAVALGARIVEKHFTLELVSSSFRDHALSATPSQMRELVERVEGAQIMLGSFDKTVQPSEEPNRVALRRSLVTRRDLEEGHELRASDVTWVRPGGGIAPGREQEFLGRCLTRSIRSGEQIREADLKPCVLPS